MAMVQALSLTSDLKYESLYEYDASSTNTHHHLQDERLHENTSETSELVFSRYFSLV